MNLARTGPVERRVGIVAGRTATVVGSMNEVRTGA